MNTIEMAPEQLRREGLEALVKELGVVGTVRFLQLFETGTGDYVKERDALLPEEDLPTLVARIQAHAHAKA